MKKFIFAIIAVTVVLLGCESKKDSNTQVKPEIEKQVKAPETAQPITVNCNCCNKSDKPKKVAKKVVKKKKAVKKVEEPKKEKIRIVRTWTGPRNGVYQAVNTFHQQVATSPKY